MSELSANRHEVLAKVESTYKTDAVEPVLTTATEDIIHQDVRSVSILPGVEAFSPPRMRGSASGVASAHFLTQADVTIEVPLLGKRGAGAGNEAPYYSDLLRACGLSETIVSATSAAYSPQTCEQASVTIYDAQRNLEDALWRLVYATGVRMNAVFNLEVNAEAYVTMTGVGIYQSQLSDPAAFLDAGAWNLLKDGSTSVTARTTGTELQVDQTIMGCKNLTLTYGGTTLPLESMQIDLGWTVDVLNTMNGASTATKALLTRGDGGRLTGAFNLQDSDAAYELLRDAMTGATEAALQAVITDGTNTITFDLPKVQILATAPAAAGNVRTWDISFAGNGDWSTLGADNELVITYT